MAAKRQRAKVQGRSREAVAILEENVKVANELSADGSEVLGGLPTDTKEGQEAAVDRPVVFTHDHTMENWGIANPNIPDVVTRSRP